MAIRGVVYLTILAVLIAPTAATAQCSFNEPTAAKALKGSLVRAHDPQGFWLTSAFKFSDTKSRCRFDASTKREAPCSTGGPDPCAAQKIRLRCQGIFNSDGVTPNNDPGWNLVILLRTRGDSVPSGESTIELSIDAAQKGRLNGDWVRTTPVCTWEEWLAIELRDPAGNAFALLGMGSR